MSSATKLASTAPTLRLPIKTAAAVRFAYALLMIFAAFAPIRAASAESCGAQRAQSTADRSRIEGDYGRLPLGFEPNYGQTDARVSFLAHGRGYQLFLSRSEAVLRLQRRHGADANAVIRGAQTVPAGVRDREQRDEFFAIRLRLAGANPARALVGFDPLPGRANYLIGKDPKKWQTDVPLYSRVEAANVYPGIDLVYHGSNRSQLEYDFLVHPGADPGLIELRFDGADKLRLDRSGNLIVQIAAGDLVEHAPKIYQPGPTDHRRHWLPGGYVLKGKDRVGLRLAAYDRTRPLVIDPLVVVNPLVNPLYSTYLGGNAQDAGEAIAVDCTGSAYVAGVTTSANFPTFPVGVCPLCTPQKGGGNTLGGAQDAFVTKLSSDGRDLAYSTYLGGTDNDAAYGIAVDSMGNAYVTGQTSSPDFPAGPHPPACSGSGGLPPPPLDPTNAFVTELSPTGSREVYSQLLQGTNGNPAGFAIAVDASGDAYITGQAGSDFFTGFGTGSSCKVKPPAYGGGASDAFVTELGGPSAGFPGCLVYSDFLGGSGDDVGAGIAVDNQGNAYVTGLTSSTNFPNATNHYGGGASDAFVAKLGVGGCKIVYSRYLGGNGADVGNAIALDAKANAYITGQTSSTNLPVTVTGNGSKLAPGAAADAFVAKFNSAGAGPTYLTYLGGSGGGTSSSSDYGHGIAVDVSGNVYVVGRTFSKNLATAGQLDGPSDAFVAKFISAKGSPKPAYFMYLGGSSDEIGAGIATDLSGNVYVTGQTASADLIPPGVTCYQCTLLPNADNAFVTKLPPLP